MATIPTPTTHKPAPDDTASVTAVRGPRPPLEIAPNREALMMAIKGIEVA
jgi:hypothetical protein